MRQNSIVRPCVPPVFRWSASSGGVMSVVLVGTRIRRVTIAAIATVVAAFLPARCAFPAAQGWNLIWSDEFDGAAGSPPNGKNWTPDFGDSGWGNNELEYYTDFRQDPGNAYLDGEGHLIIKAEALSVVPSEIPSCLQTLITQVSAIGAAANQAVYISGCGFGSNAPYEGDSSYLEIHDNAALGWDAGYLGDDVTVNVTSWTDKQIVLGGFGGRYGKSGRTFKPGDQITITVRNPATWSAGGCSTPRCSAIVQVKEGQARSFASFYASARLKTQCLQTLQYGRIEARIKLPYGQGIWPAFWMLGSDIDTVGWPLAGEIDIMEHIDSDGWVRGTVHGPAQAGCAAGTPAPCQYATAGPCGASDAGQQVNGDFSQDYHVFAVEWDQDQIVKFFIDDPDYQHPYFRVSPNSNYPYPWVFDDPFFLLLNVAVGGNFPGNPNPTTFAQGKPREMYVDYVRVYQQTAGPTQAARAMQLPSSVPRPKKAE